MAKSKYRPIKVKVSEVLRAMDKVANRYDDWQAQYLEVLLLPKVYKRWREVNASRYPDLSLTRHDGLPHRGFTPPENGAIGDAKGWAKFAGYVLWYYTDPKTGDGFGWNRITDDWYGHSPSTCWNGVGRDTLHRFVEAIVQASVAYRKGDEPHYSLFDDMQDRGIVLVNDLQPELQPQLLMVTG